MSLGRAAKSCQRMMLRQLLRYSLTDLRVKSYLVKSQLIIPRDIITDVMATFIINICQRWREFVVLKMRSDCPKTDWCIRKTK